MVNNRSIERFQAPKIKQNQNQKFAKNTKNVNLKITYSIIRTFQIILFKIIVLLSKTVYPKIK